MLNKEEYIRIQSKKISDFCNLTGVKNYRVAENYLNECEWDEQFAAQKYLSSLSDNVNDYSYNKPKEYEKHIIPVNEIKNENKPKIINDNKNKDIIRNGYLEFKMSETFIKNSKDSGPFSESLNYISKNLKSVDRFFYSFLEKLKNIRGIIIIFNEESFNRLKDQIKIINENNLNDDIRNNCIIFPTLNNSLIGVQLVEKLSIVSFPTYIFCKYKDDKGFYITDKMEGAFEISFFFDCFFRIVPSSEGNLNIINNSNNNINDIQNDIIKKKVKNNDFKKNENKNINENKENNKLKHNVLMDNYLKNKNYKNNIDQNRNINNKNLLNKKKINEHKYDENNPNYSNNKNLDKKKGDENKIEKEEKKKEEINKNINRNNNYMQDNFGDYFLGDSVLIGDLFKNSYYNYNNNKYNNSNNYNKNNINNIDNNFKEPYNNNNNKNQNNTNKRYQNPLLDNNNNLLADSIYQLSDGEVLQKRENQMRALEREEEEREKKEQEKKRKEEEEENRLKNIKKNYEDESEMAKMLLPKEPSDNDPNVCHIIFRIPDGEKNIERKFLKTDKVAILYNFVKSIGREIFMEPDATDFEILCIGFPPKNLENKKNNTLEEERLFPNSILQIKEK